MSTINDYLNSPTHKLFAHSELWERVFAAQRRWASEDFMNYQRSVQLAMQPYMALLAATPSVISALSNAPTFETIVDNFERLQKIHKLLQPLAEYQAVIEDIALTIIDSPDAELLNLNEEMPTFDESSSIDGAP